MFQKKNFSKSFLFEVKKLVSGGECVEGTVLFLSVYACGRGTLSKMKTERTEQKRTEK